MYIIINPKKVRAKKKFYQILFIFMVMFTRIFFLYLKITIFSGNMFLFTGSSIQLVDEFYIYSFLKEPIKRENLP